MTLEPELPLVEGRGLSKAFPGVVALDDVSFRIGPGEVVGLVGKNGAGKSTLIKILAGVVTPDAGDVLVDSKIAEIETPHDARRAGLAFVHQELVDVPSLSVADNVFLGLELPKAGPLVKDRELRRRARRVLALLEADISPRMKVATLSPVQQRLVMIARALVQQARVIVLDEPSTSLTAAEVEHLHGIVRRLANDGIAILYVSHRLSEILSLTSRILVMRDGRLVEDRPTRDVDHDALVRLITGEAASVSITHEGRPGLVSTDGEPLLRVDSVAAGPLLTRATFTVHNGEIVGLAGLLGSGRTEVAKVVCGARQPASGRMWFKGHRLRPRSPAKAIRAGIVLLPEDRRAEGNVLDFTIRENVTLPSLRRMRMARFVPLPSRGRERDLATLMSQKLQIRATGPETRVRWLSGGNQQKVLLAKWLTHGADLFIFDEPTQGIDVVAKEEIFGLIRTVRAEGKGVILISSDFSELVRMCDRVVALREGKTVAEFSGEEITEYALLRACYGAATGGYDLGEEADGAHRTAGTTFRINAQEERDRE